MAITFNKTRDRLFISIAKKEMHTFVMFGIYNATKVIQMLCRVGENFNFDFNLNNMSFLERRLIELKLLISEVPGKLQSEILAGSQKKEDPISYQAHDISLKQYIEFLQLLEAMETEQNQYLCYKPIKETETDVTFILTDDPAFSPSDEQNGLNNGFNTLSVRNTCRHVAIGLVQTVLKEPKSELISSQFYNDLPYKTKLDFCKPSDEIPFYVLPVSPAAYPELSTEKRFIVVKLYQRMENLLLIEPNSLQTQNKFISLKNLYNDLLDPQKDLTLDELLISIRNWKEINKAALTPLRKTYFWDYFITRESATMRMFHEIDKMKEQNFCNSPGTSS